ncbi:MAG TPA: helix-turn-helix domain-containing protein [Pseudonocardiaceae bacterium]|nr:helix-turn-helix domain-containing protein [Pseudonocardiaceae bacterium]
MKNSHSEQSSHMLSIAEVAWLLGVDNSWVYRAIRLGVLPVVRRRRRLLIPAHALAHLADSSDPLADQAGQTERGDAR